MLSDSTIYGDAGDTISLGLTSFPADFPAKTFLTPASELESTGNALVYGKRCGEWFVSYDPGSSSWKTSQLCLDGEWSEFSETWPRAGWMRNGMCCPLRPLVPRTSGNESFLWPTPASVIALIHLNSAVKMWSTPTVRDAGTLKHVMRGSCSLEMGNEIIQPLPVQAGGTLNPTWVEWLMGFPLGWTDLKDSATPSSRKSRNG